jgi:hypothetical protein
MVKRLVVTQADSGSSPVRHSIFREVCIMGTKAVVRVELEVIVRDKWGDDCTVGQVKLQAYRSAMAMLNKAIQKEPNIVVAMSEHNVLVSFSDNS